MDGSQAFGSSPANGELLAGRWTLLFPVTYLVHIGEEIRGDLPAWTAGRFGPALSPDSFVLANGLLWLLMVGVLVGVRYRRLPAFLVVSLAAIVLVNALLHVGGTILTRSYHPGVVSGVLLWLPLGLSALGRGRRALAGRDFRIGVILGVAAHLLVPLVWLAVALASGSGWRGA